MKKSIDWESIARDYRLGVKTLRAIAEEHGGVSHVAIKKRADREGWTRDLSAKIQAAAEAKVNKSVVNSEVNKDRAVNERAVIEANAEAQKDIILAHRNDIKRGRKIVADLVSELETMTKEKSIGHAVRVDSAKKLAETMKTLIAAEREAFGVDSRYKPDGETTDANLTISFVAAQ